MDPARSGLNFYSYCMADPLNFVDPYGLCPSQDNSSFLRGLGQGGLNVLQGFQDMAVGLGNSALAVNNPLLSMFGPLFESPNWTRDLVVSQSDSEYAWSMGLINAGVALLPIGGGAKFGALQLEKGIVMPAGSMSTGLMSLLTRITGNEWALLRNSSGQRILRMGTKNSVCVGDATRVIAHTHTPPGILDLSSGDLKSLYYMAREGQIQQRSTIIINQVGGYARKILPEFITDFMK